MIRETTQRALNYARAHGVLPVAAMGNESTDLGNPTWTTPARTTRPVPRRTRTVDNSCITVPSESKGVVSVGVDRPVDAMSYFSNYGTEQTESPHRAATPTTPGRDPRPEEPRAGRLPAERRRGQR